MTTPISVVDFCEAWQADLVAQSGLAWLLVAGVAGLVVLGVRALVVVVLTRRWAHQLHRDTAAREALARGWMTRRQRDGGDSPAGARRGGNSGRLGVLTDAPPGMRWRDLN